ncbi:hypothetical protein HAX54_010827 [Datura stramonium]|uniref:MI domain-containing protein n=1 Tax=Datura stramonium TaxID=4076 RepID=A0ABS8TIP8_DATST|nr:hypothetical protein [Datura stramonium]
MSSESAYNCLSLGFESVLATLEDEVTDAPKAAVFLGHIFGRLISENVISLKETARLIRHGGEEPGHLLQTGLGYEVLKSTFDLIRSEKGESALRDICSTSSTQLEDFRPPELLLLALQSWYLLLYHPSEATLQILHQQTKRTKKAGIVGKYGTRYGASLRKQIKKMEVSQHSKYFCGFCGKLGSTIRRLREQTES